jgi:hypothetical protein
MNNQAEIDRLNSKIKHHENRIDEINEIVGRWCLDKEAALLCGKTSIDDLWGYTQRVAMTIHKNKNGDFEVLAGCEEYFRKYAPLKMVSLLLELKDRRKELERLMLELKNCISSSDSSGPGLTDKQRQASAEIRWKDELNPGSIVWATEGIRLRSVF